MTKLFISYARGDDEAFVSTLFSDLCTHGYDVWFDRVNMPSRGLTFLKEIRDEIDRRDCIILVVGPKAVKSDYVNSEWQHALTFAKVVLPIIRIGSYEYLPEELRELHAPDFQISRPYNEALQELLTILSQPLIEGLGHY